MAKYGKYEKRKPKKRGCWGFLVFMFLYAAVILAAANWGLQQFWDYIDAYEASRINHPVDAYMEALTPQYVCDRSADLIDSIDHHLQNEQECEKVILDFLSGGITHARKASECTDTRTVYVLRSGGKVIGQVKLHKGILRHKGNAVELSPFPIYSNLFQPTVAVQRCYILTAVVEYQNLV
jgi:hypothetical protein